MFAVSSTHRSSKPKTPEEVLWNLYKLINGGIQAPTKVLSAPRSVPQASWTNVATWNIWWDGVRFWCGLWFLFDSFHCQDTCTRRYAKAEVLDRSATVRWPQELWVVWQESCFLHLWSLCNKLVPISTICRPLILWCIIPKNPDIQRSKSF